VQRVHCAHTRRGKPHGLDGHRGRPRSWPGQLREPHNCGLLHLTAAAPRFRNRTGFWLGEPVLIRLTWARVSSLGQEPRRVAATDRS
jgi:hypothetical protein